MSRLRLLDEAEGLKESLIDFHRAAWPQLERKRYLHNWHLEAIAEHLEAVTARQIKRLIINVPFRTSKSTMVSVTWPSWLWARDPGHQFLCGSHAEKLATRDNIKHRRLVMSPWYRQRWGEEFDLTGDQNQKLRFENDKGGYRIGFGMTGGITGDGGDTVIIDDPHDRNKAQSDDQRETALETFDQSIITRLNDPDDSAVVVIMQRLHENDLSGHLLEEGGWEHLMLPMEYDPKRHCVTGIGFSDPRGSDEDGEPLPPVKQAEHANELLWPERFSAETVEALKRTLGPYGTSGQLQQEPTPPGGGIIKREWWQPWPAESYPPCEYMLASLDTAYTEKQENDSSALTIWGVFRSSGAEEKLTGSVTLTYPGLGAADTSIVRRREPGSPKVILLYAWEGRLELNDLVVGVNALCSRGSLDAEEYEQAKRVLKLPNLPRFPVDRMVIEAKAAGHSVQQELARLYGDRGEYGVELVDPTKWGDKTARMYAVQHMFSDGMVYAPDRKFADAVIDNVSMFPKATHDDLADSVSMGLRYLRLSGLLLRQEEHARNISEALAYKPKERPLY